MPSTTMPHSTSPEDAGSPLADEVLQEDTPEQEQTIEGISQADDGADQDMSMADVGAVGDDASNTVAEPKSEIKLDVKLEDLFADMDSDDEFSSSNSKSQELKSTDSQEAPPSPM